MGLSSRAAPLSARRLVRAAERPLLPALASALLAALIAWGTLTLDGSLRMPGFLSPGSENARAMLSALLGAIVTVSVFTFWMRAVMVQLLSRDVSVRLMSLFLEDRFQEWLVGGVVGTLTYVTIVLGAIPGAEGRPPHLSVALAVLAAMGSVVAILIAIRDAIRSMDLGRTVHRLATSILERLDAMFVPPRDARLPPSGAAAGETLFSRRIGWVGGVDEARLLRAIPHGEVLRLDVRPGSFVFDGTPLASVPRGADEGAIRDAIEVTETQTFGQDLRFDLQMLVDVGEQALALSSPDSSTAYEVIAHLRPVLVEVFLRDPRRWVTDDGGRIVLRDAYLTHEQVIRDTVERLRRGAAPYPPVTIELLRALGDLRQRVEAAGREHLATIIEGEARSLVEDSCASVRNEGDKMTVREVAVRQGILGEEASTPR